MWVSILHRIAQSFHNSSLWQKKERDYQSAYIFCVLPCSFFILSSYNVENGRAIKSKEGTILMISVFMAK